MPHPRSTRLANDSFVFPRACHFLCLAVLASPATPLPLCSLILGVAYASTHHPRPRHNAGSATGGACASILSPRAVASACAYADSTPPFLRAGGAGVDFGPHPVPLATLAWTLPVSAHLASTPPLSWCARHLLQLYSAASQQRRCDVASASRHLTDTPTSSPRQLGSYPLRGARGRARLLPSASTRSSSRSSSSLPRGIRFHAS